MAEKPSVETLLMLGAMAPKSQEEGKPTTDVPLTAVEISALARLSNLRFQMLMDTPGEEAQQMAAIYLGITSKLMISALAIAAKESLQRGDAFGLTEDPPEENVPK